MPNEFIEHTVQVKKTTKNKQAPPHPPAPGICNHHLFLGWLQADPKIYQCLTSQWHLLPNKQVWRNKNTWIKLLPPPSTLWSTSEGVYFLWLKNSTHSKLHDLLQLLTWGSVSFMLLLHCSLYSCLIFLTEVEQPQDRIMKRELWDSNLSVYLLDSFTLELETGRGEKSMTSKCIFLPLSCSKIYLTPLRMFLYLQKAIKCLF